MNDAIKLAIEKGGYENKPIWITESDIILDPLFWQALSKALGWKEFAGRGEGSYPIWKWQAHRYFDLVLTGGNKEKFWEELLQ
jgi:hypothetical protein